MNTSARNWDAVIIGAGAAGMMCALTAAQQGRSVLLLDHAKKPAEKIRISGGGRCNFTNLNAGPENFLSRNPHFCRSALARFTPQHFISMLQRHGIGYHEKTPGQLFCDDGAEAIIAMLKSECEAAGVCWSVPCEVTRIERGGRFRLVTSRGTYQTAALVVASGGLSIPKIGATPFGYKIAGQFGVPVTQLKPGLVPLSFHPAEWAPYADLAGVSLEVGVSLDKQHIRGNLLFTHRGLSGPPFCKFPPAGNRANRLPSIFSPIATCRNYSCNSVPARCCWPTFWRNICPGVWPTSLPHNGRRTNRSTCVPKKI